MYIERLKQTTLENAIEMYPDFQIYKPVMFDPNDHNILFHTIKRDLNHIFHIILESKYNTHQFKNGTFRDNNYLYNEFCYIVDCCEWNIQQLREFLSEYSRLNNVMRQTNLFVIYNFDKTDKTTQELVGTLIEKYSRQARFWLISSVISKILYKITSRVLVATIRSPNRKQLKTYLLGIIKPPTFEILIDKILEKADDYGKALLYLDMLAIDPSILNRTPFSEEIEQVDRFIADANYREEYYPKLREVCYRLLEKLDFLNITYVFIRHFSKTIRGDHFAKILSHIAKLECSNMISNKQVWLLENWFLHIIFICNGPTTAPTLQNSIKNGPLVI